MNIKKLCKLKSSGRYKHYKSFGWLGRIAYRLRSEKFIQHYLKTGKYIKVESDTTYELVIGSGLYIKDLFITSRVKKSRIKNIPYGCVCVGKVYEDKS